MSESIQRKAKVVFSIEIVKDENENKILIASSDGNIELVTKLLSTCMLDINKAHDGGEDYHFYDDYEARTPLFEAARNGHTDVVRLLLKRGAKPNIAHDFGDTPLLMAAEDGHTEVVKLLLDGGADPNMADEDKDYPLHRAAREGYKEIVQMLLDQGADPNLTNEGGVCPLLMASYYGRIGVGILLIENGARPCVEFHVLLLLKAIEEGNAQEVKNHLRPRLSSTRSRAINVNFDGLKPLKKAIWRGNKEIVNLLLSSGANPSPPKKVIDWYNEMKGKPRETPLKIALETGRRDLARILLDAGAEPDKVDEETINEWGSDWGADNPPPSEYDVGRGMRQSLITKYFARNVGSGKQQSLITKYFVRK